MNILKHVRRLRENDGQAVAWMVLMMVVMMGLAGISVDCGHAYVAKRQLQASTDAAALAAAGEDAELLRRALARAEVVVALESVPSPASELATVLIPGHTLMEKLGTVTNCEGRVQRIRAALPPATATPAETRVLGMLAAALGAEGWAGDPARVQREIAAAVPAYAAAGNGGRACFGETAG